MLGAHHNGKKDPQDRLRRSEAPLPYLPDNERLMLKERGAHMDGSVELLSAAAALASSGLPAAVEMSRPQTAQVRAAISAALDYLGVVLRRYVGLTHVHDDEFRQFGAGENQSASGEAAAAVP